MGLSHHDKLSTTPQEVEVAVVVHEGLVLVGQRPPGVELEGYAEFPGGKRLPDEPPGACAVREALEETGICVEVVRPLVETTYPYPHGLIHLTFYLCRPADNHAGEPWSPFRWVTKGEVFQLPFPPANRVALERLRKLLERQK
jgi:mutator protein MutT